VHGNGARIIALPCRGAGGSRTIRSTCSIKGHGLRHAGNYSGDRFDGHRTQGRRFSCAYSANGAHTLLLGTRRANAGAAVVVRVDGGAPVPIDLHLTGEDVLVRVALGAVGGGAHTVTVTHAGATGSFFYFDYLEVAYPSMDLPDFPAAPHTTLATDWDTDHSIALAPERTAWLIHKLGFQGRANHYAGALWFYELVRRDISMRRATITFFRVAGVRGRRRRCRWAGRRSLT